jgi:hypothetical protein
MEINGQNGYDKPDILASLELEKEARYTFFRDPYNKLKTPEDHSKMLNDIFNIFRNKTKDTEILQAGLKLIESPDFTVNLIEKAKNPAQTQKEETTFKYIKLKRESILLGKKGEIDISIANLLSESKYGEPNNLGNALSQDLRENVKQINSRPQSKYHIRTPIKERYENIDISVLELTHHRSDIIGSMKNLINTIVENWTHKNIDGAEAISNSSNFSKIINEHIAVELDTVLNVRASQAVLSQELNAMIADNSSKNDQVTSSYKVNSPYNKNIETNTKEPFDERSLLRKMQKYKDNDLVRCLKLVSTEDIKSIVTSSALKMKNKQGITLQNSNRKSTFLDKIQEKLIPLTLILDGRFLTTLTDEKQLKKTENKETISQVATRKPLLNNIISNRELGL